MSENVSPSALSAAAAKLNEFLLRAQESALEPAIAERFASYAALLLRWNARMNLTAIRDEDGILQRHFVESIACARRLPQGIETLLDLGSGAGFPGIPIALCRPEIAVTLAESQSKKAAFLNEAARTLELGVTVHHGRADTLRSKFDCVALRAVDRMELAVREAGELVNVRGWMALLSTWRDAADLQKTAGSGYLWQNSTRLPGSEGRILLLGRRIA